MSTFKEIAHEARIIAESQSYGSIDYARMIARLAEAMDRLEYNTAYWLASDHLTQGELGRDPEHYKAALPELIEAWLLTLRSDVYRQEVGGWKEGASNG